MNILISKNEIAPLNVGSANLQKQTDHRPHKAISLFM